MESRTGAIAVLSSIANNNGAGGDIDFNAIQFEKRLMQLKDSQESISSMSSWCLEHRQHHKKIVNAWLSVLKKVKVEQRLTLFYLANDVIQYSKRKNYDFVESWGTTLQKATTMVREEKVKNRILRIFKIWEQRGIYGEEFLTDLSGLISASPAGRKFDPDSQEFQTSYLISRIRNCVRLENETDGKLKSLKENNLKITDSETLCASLKDRRHVEDVEKEVETGILLFEGYVNALKAEIKSRTHLVSVLTQAETFYNTERKEVKVVVNAYKNFTTRVKNLKRKLDELRPSLSSPIPSPDVNAPSPEPDSDFEQSNHESNVKSNKLQCSIDSGMQVYATTETFNVGYYRPSTTQSNTNQHFNSNCFTSFIGSDLSFDLQNLNTDRIFTDTHGESSSSYQPYDPTAPPGYSQDTPVYNSSGTSTSSTAIQSSQSQPLLPPPMPPFDTVPSYSTDSTYAPATDSYVNHSTYQSVESGASAYVTASEVQIPYSSSGGVDNAYNPEEEVETWEPEASWEVPLELETPESPPMFEKEGFADPIEYDESKTGHHHHHHHREDVDHRVLMGATDTDHRLGRTNANKDVDHRNLISLTGSPGNDPGPGPGLLQPPPAPPDLWLDNVDQDYRTQPSIKDQDYRQQQQPPPPPPSKSSIPVDIAKQLILPPPPPPATKPPHNKDNVESIDMDLSDDDAAAAAHGGGGSLVLPLLPSLLSNNNNNNNRRNRSFNKNDGKTNRTPVGNGAISKGENEDMNVSMNMMMMPPMNQPPPPPLPPFCNDMDMPPPGNLWYDGQPAGMVGLLPPPHLHHHNNNQHNNNNVRGGRHNNEFRSGRGGGGGGGRGGHFVPPQSDLYNNNNNRGRPPPQMRNRGSGNMMMRGGRQMRGMNNNNNNNMRPRGMPRSFRPHFRGGF